MPKFRAWKIKGFGPPPPVYGARPARDLDHPCPTFSAIRSSHEPFGPIHKKWTALIPLLAIRARSLVPPRGSCDHSQPTFRFWFSSPNPVTQNSVGADSRQRSWFQLVPVPVGVAKVSIHTVRARICNTHTGTTGTYVETKRLKLEPKLEPVLEPNTNLHADTSTHARFQRYQFESYIAPNRLILNSAQLDFYRIGSIAT